MARYNGISTIKTSYNVADYYPLDTRMLVPTYDDLTTESNWLINGESNAYNGMIVAVGSDPDQTKNGIYRLFDENNSGEDAVPEVTIEDNWHKLADLSEVSTLIERLQAIDESLTKRVESLEEKQTEVFAYREGFPSQGLEGKLYIAVDEQKTYVWINEVGYLCVGEDNEDPDIICGGDATMIG